MNKLSIGDYVRVEVNDYTRHTIIISKVKLSKVKYSSNDIVAIEDSELLVHKKDIINSSPDIIDLIEVGDYVNGHRVVEVDLDDIDDYGNTFRYIKTEHDYSLNYGIKENEIETILTKEQFENISYKVGE